jgi:two-component system, sporulation sensor kinase E
MIESPSQKDSSAGIWNRLSLRRKLALAMLGQCTFLLVLAFWTVLTLGSQIEVSEYGGRLQSFTNHLAMAIEKQLPANFAVGGVVDSVDQLDDLLVSALTNDPGLEQINLFRLEDGNWVPWRQYSLEADANRSLEQARLDLDNPRLQQAVHESTVDDQVRRRGEREVFSAYAPLKAPSGGTVALITLDASADALLGHIEHIKPILIVVLLVAFGLAIVLAPLVSKSIIRPIDALVTATDALAGGDFNVHVGTGSADELGKLTSSFNRMTDTIRRHQADLQNNNRQLDLLNRQLRDTMVELEQVNEDLSESRNFFSTLVARTPSPILVTDPAHRIILFNEAASDLFGFRAEEIVGETFDRVFSRNNRSEIREHMDQEIQRGKVWRGEFLGRTKSGTTPMLAATVSPVRDDHGSIRAYMYLAQDVTETRQLQNLIVQMERMSTRGEMAGEIAHEINNYLTILSGNLDVIPMLLAAGNQEKVERKFAAMKDVVEKIARFSDGLMGYRDAQSEPINCDVNRLIESLVAFLKPQNRYDGIHFQLNLDERMPMIRLDVGQIQQVLVNLLNNAADSVHENGRDDGRVNIATFRRPEGEGFSITVTDNGTGISSDVVGRLFHERFTNKQRGHGLGLLSCRRIVESHRGRLEVESQKGNGATFTVTLPADECTEVLPPPLVRASSDAV